MDQSQWRNDSLPANLAGMIPTGWPSTRAGASPPPGIGIPEGPHEYIVGGPGSVAWSEGAEDPFEAGVLGQTPMALLGLWDTRPYLAKPGPENSDWYRETRPVQGRGLTLRVRPTNQQGTRFRITNQGLGGTERQAVLAVLVAGFDSPIQELAPARNAKVVNVPTAANVEYCVAARMGPNLMPALQTRGVAEVDLYEWAGGSRFVAAWLWGFWVALEDDQQTGIVESYRVQWTVWPEAPLRRWHPLCMSWPVQVIPDGPLVVADANQAFRLGAVPTGGTSQYRLAVVNGGPSQVAIEMRYLLGPLARLAAYTGLAEAFNVPPLQTVVRTAAAGVELYGYSHVGVWSANTAGTGNPSGPIIISLSQSGG